MVVPCWRKGWSAEVKDQLLGTAVTATANVSGHLFHFLPYLYLQGNSTYDSPHFSTLTLSPEMSILSALPNGITSHFKVYLERSAFHEAFPDLAAFELWVITSLVLSSATRGCLTRCPLVSCQIALAKQELDLQLFTPRQGLCHGESLLAGLKQCNGCLSPDENIQRENPIKRT